MMPGSASEVSVDVAPSASGPVGTEISVVVPVYDEEDAAAPLAREIASAFRDFDVEILFVDDASRDATLARLTELAATLPQLRVLHHRQNAGQSRAIRSGVLAARSPIVVTLDGDGQNDPADAPALALALLRAPAIVGLIGGERQARKDTTAKRWASRIANAVRRRLLRDEAVDTGCGLKAMRREAFLQLPYFDHMHRYLPALMLREGFEIAFRPVSHRPRQSGRSKYTNLERLMAAATDLAGVLWLSSRARDPGRVEEVS